VVEKILVETDFLFALNPRNHLHQAALKLLEKAAEKRALLHISPAAPIEASLTLMSRGFNYEQAARILEAMERAIARYTKAISLRLDLSTVNYSFRLRAKYSQLGFFDSLHASLALLNMLTYVGSDEKVAKVVEEEGGIAQRLSS